MLIKIAPFFKDLNLIKMNNEFDNIAAAVLAAGKGNRIGHHLPKVLYPIIGKPMLYYTLELIDKIPLHNKYVVVGTKATDVKASLRDGHVNYIFQKEQLGTAHAAGLVINHLPENIDELIIFNGDDSAFFEVNTIRKFIDAHRKSGAKVSFITSNVDNPSGLGRVVRDENNKLLKIVEEKDATGEEKKIKEVNVGCYILNRKWSGKTVPEIQKSNTGEYYITDLIYLALKDGETVNTYLLEDDDEWRGVNTQDELKNANERMLKKIIKRKEPTVFIFDIDNTIINTDAVKEYINKDLVSKLLGESLSGDFWNEYESTRNKMGYVSIPDISDAFAEKTKDPKYSELVRNMFYTVPFENFVYKGVYELMEYLDPRGEISILTEGDLVYQPMKIKNLRLSKYLDEMYVFENKGKNASMIGDIYRGRRIIIVDDKITDLEYFKKAVPSALTIHLKQGTYQNLVPNDVNFKVDFVAENIDSLASFIKGLY